MDLGELQEFVAEAVANGWPANTTARTDEDFPGFYGGSYRRGDWRYLDVWSGATTDAGMMIVFRQEKPIWTCTYRGGILHGNTHVNQTSIEENELFNFLIDALRTEHTGPIKLRGPASYQSTDGRWQYTFNLRGDLAGFVGVEQIFDGSIMAYERMLIGGRVGDGVAYAPRSLNLGPATD